MFTSRAEYRLMLREDNADLRLTETGRTLGVVGDPQWTFFQRKCEAIERERQRLRDCWVRPADLVEGEDVRLLGDSLRREARALDLIARPAADHAGITSIPVVGAVPIDEDLREQVVEQIEVQAKYAGYIERQQDEVERTRRAEAIRLPTDLDYAAVKGLSAEVSEKLMRHRPQTLGQAGRIPGITPAAVSLLLVHLKRRSA
jgi:tRNA uridine 5-carboxymethylaminomethyl modification enzyme